MQCWITGAIEECMGKYLSEIFARNCRNGGSGAMFAHLQLMLVAALPALTGVPAAVGEVVQVVSVAESPAFAEPAPAQVAAVGGDAELRCTVLRLNDKSVSWVRSRDLHILSHAGAVFTADPRVSVAVRGAAGASVHTLRIQGLRVSDSGRYECQLNTEPKMSQFFNLTVVDEVVPETVVSVVGGRQLSAAVGGAVTLSCEARYSPPPRALPRPPLDIRWYFGDQPVDLQSSRGGVSLDTERWAARSVSRLTLGALAPRDAGRYRCAAGHAADTLRLTVTDYTDGALMEAMQRDQSAMSSANSGHSITRRPSLYTIATLILVILRR